MIFCAVLPPFWTSHTEQLREPPPNPPALGSNGCLAGRALAPGARVQHVRGACLGTLAGRPGRALTSICWETGGHTHEIKISHGTGTQTGKLKGKMGMCFSS